jgi:energy-coupling factor transporter transmembrane protein EcfT
MAETMIAYPKHWFVLIVLVVESIVLYLFLAALLDANSILREFWLVLCPLVGGILFLLLVPPIFTNHSITSSVLRLRMGLLIDAEIPTSAIVKVKETSMTRGGLKIGIGVRYLPITRHLFVTSGFGNLVSLKLEEAVPIGKLRKRMVEEIIVNVNFPRGMMDALENATSGSRKG